MNNQPINAYGGQGQEKKGENITLGSRGEFLLNRIKRFRNTRVTLALEVFKGELVNIPML